ncbi:hypothetical protein ACKWTF_013447 [Chironomus riparius]
MDEMKNFPRHRVLRSSRGLKEKPWVRDELNVLQLDFMDRHVAKIADERDAIQKKTFTKWVNNHLRKAGGKVTDLFVDLRDGHNLLTLLELLSNEKLPREKGKMRWHMLQNIDTALKFLQQKNVKVVNIRPVDIYDGNPKLILGLIWTIILHFQISDIMLGNDENVSAREALLRWAKKTTEKYPGVQINDFTTSWRDGLAFSAVLHRNRPDLVDWRNIREIKSRERLERVFSTMEKEFSVYKILDSQDVDTSAPDEKSMITYISSIYHVFPQPPKIHPLMDSDSQTQSQEYRTQAQKLLIWCREKTIMLQERTLDRDITSLKKLLEDLKKLRNIEVPERQKDKQRLTVLYSQLERYFSSVGETSLELDLRPESLELFWYRLITALADKEHELLLHIQHLQQLEMLADKVIREVEQFDQKITDISFRISNESSRIDKIHRLDARTIVETIETEIELLEKPIEQMIKDSHALIDGNHAKSKDLYSDATQVNQKYSQLRTTFHLQMLSKMSPTRDLTNGRSLEHNPYLRDIEQHISWCQQRLSNILQATWGSDYNSITSELDKHQVEHKTIDQYHSKVLQCERQQANLSGDEAHLYQQKLNQLKKIYAELLSLSTKRLCDLHALHDFITVATDELNWLSTHENIELNRDWSETSMELMQLNSSYKQLVNEFNGRDQQIRAAMEKGEGLVAQHPASKMVASYMQEIQEQRSWIYQLIHCFEVHFKHLADFQNFYNDIKEQKEWLVARKDLLETKYSDSDFNLDRGDILLRGMQTILEELNQFSVVVDKLAKRSQSIVPLTERKYLIHNKPYTVQSLCTYKQDDQIVLEKGEVADLIDTSQQVYWKVKTIKGGEKIIPSACLMIPPPNEEAFELVNKLRLSQQKMIELWQIKQIHLRRNMILATIRVVKEWSFEHFVALGYEQRNDIRRALNEDSDKVLAEADPTDQQIVHLKQEMIDVNRLFDEFERRASSEEENKQTSQLFNEKCLQLSSRLESLAKELDGIILSRLPQDRTASDAALETILDFNRRLGFFDSDLKNLKETFRSIPLKSPAQKKNLDNLNELYKELITQANLHKERLNLLESSLTGLEKNGDIIKDLENVLASHIIMPSTIEGLRELLKQLTALQEIIYENQSSMDKTNNSANQLGRMGVPTKIIEDLKHLHTRVERLNSRWNNVNLQLADRIQSVETAIGLLKNLQTSLILEETWVETQTQKLKLLPTISNALDLDSLLTETVRRGNNQISDTNLCGGKLIKVSEQYNDKSNEFKASLNDYNAPETLNAEPEIGDVYGTLLDELNGKYERLLSLLQQSLANLADDADKERYAESLRKPLRTFRQSSITEEFVVEDSQNENVARAGDPQTQERQLLWKILNVLGIKDPKTGNTLTVHDAIKLKLFDLNSGTLRIEGQDTLSIDDALKQGIIDTQMCDNLKTLNDLSKKYEITIGDTESTKVETVIHGDGSFDDTDGSESRVKQAVIERFALCEENISILLKWINDIEQRLSKIGGPQEHIEELHAQINVLKHIKNDIDLQARPVASCLEQVRQLVLTSGNVLSIAEVTQLENSGRQLRFRVDRAHDSSVKLIKHLQNSYDELDKLQGEMHDFARWLQSGQEVLDNEHAYLSDLKQLPAQSIRIKELLKEIIAHQADLRFITISTQKFVDEGKDYLNVLNDLRLSLPERLPNIEPIASFKSPVRQTVSDLQQRYSDLLNQVNAFADRQNNIKESYRIYIEQLEKSRTWLSDVQLRVSSVIAHPVGTDIETIQEQSNIAKSLYNEFLANGKLIDHLQQSLNGLLVSLTGITTPSENAGLEIPVDEVKRDYKSLLDAVDNRCKLLEVAYVQAQGVQDALDNLIAHMKQTEDNIHIQSQPASLIVEKLLEQIREHQFILSDLETHRASLNSVTESAKELLKVPSNARLAKVIETKLRNVTDHYSRLRDKAVAHNEFLEAILKKLTKFNNDSTIVETELKHLQELSHIDEKSIEVLMKYLQDIVQNRKKIQPAYEDCIYLGRDLVERKDVTDTYVVKDKMKRLQTLWDSLERRLDDKLKLTKQKSEKLGAFEICKTEIYLWLSQMETRTSAFDPVALDLSVIRRQSDEHKLLLNEYKEFNRVIQRINDIGAEYDSLIRTSSPIMNNSVDRQDLTDLTSMQQELLEINNRYNFIGVRLNDRQKDLDDTRTAVQRQKENLEGLNSFFDKLEKNLPKYNLTVRENAEKCIKHVRKQQDEMYERQSTLDTTKIQIRELLQLKPNAPGSEQLKYELDSLVDRWTRLAELLKECSIFSEQSLDFIETHDLIFNWLISKEKLFSVLGPISSDPRTVSSQMQQVSVLRDEFKAQQTQLDYLRDIGGGLVNHFQPTSQEGKAITNKMNDIEKKWNDLADQLEKRYKNLIEVADTSKDFDASLNRLRENLQQISDSLDNLPSDSDFEGKLHKITQLERQLEGQRPLLADAEATAASLTSVISDAKSSAEIKAKVQALGKQYLALQRKLDNIKAENDAALKDKKHFLENCAKTIGWIGSKLANFTSPLLISAHKPTLQYQIETHEPIYREVISKEYEIIMLLNRGNDLQQKLGELKDLEKINSQWTRLKEEAQDRQTRLQKAYDVYKNYEKTSSGFLQWLSNAERELIAMKPGILVKKELDKELRDVQTLRNDVLKKSSDYDKTQNLCGNFLTACDVDKDTLMSEMQSTKERWDELNRLINLKIERINSFVEKVMDFSDNFRQLSALVQRNEDSFDSLERIHGANAGRDPRSLEKIKTIKDDNSELKKNFQNLRALVENIASEARPVGYNSDNLYADLERLSDRILTLQARLDDRFNDLTIASNAVAKFNESINYVTLDLSALENEVDSLSSPAREVKVVRSQLDAGNDLLQKIEDVGNKISGIEANGDTMIEKGYVTRPSEVHEPLDQIKRKRSRLESRTKDYIEAVQKALKMLTRFYEDYEVALNEISQIDFELKKLKTIGSEAAQIRLQQQDFQQFRRNVVDPMERKIDDLNDLGKDLIRSAHETVSTGNLEHDLEKIVEKWSEIKSRVSERDRKLDQALLQSGKFQDALQGILRWLTDSEEMIKNQKSPSIDYKVAKAQLQEQKFLMKMIGDNQNSVSSILKLGEEVLQGCEPGERINIEMQLKDLTGRFDHLKNKADERTILLENAVDVAKTLQDQLTPLVTFLDRSERTLKNLENIPSDEDKIQQAIYEHDRLNSEILSKDPDVAALVSLKNSIRKYFEPEEAELANDKIDSVSDRYNMLRDDSERLGALLNKTKQEIKQFAIAYQDLFAWCDKQDRTLAQFKNASVHVDVINEQVNKLEDINREIQNKESTIQTTIDIGNELLRSISQDEALKLKDKLDSLGRRYIEISKKSSDYLSNAKDAHALAQDFHGAHNRLVNWMQNAETILVGNAASEIEILTLESDLTKMRSELEALNSLGPQLAQLSSEEGGATIEGIISRDNRRFDAIVEQIQRKAERLQMIAQRSKEINVDLDELIHWFRETEGSLRDAATPSIQPKVVKNQLLEHRSLNDSISGQKGRVREVTANAKKLIRELQSSNDNLDNIREKLEDLKDVVDSVTNLSAERLSVLEQVAPLSEHFADAQDELDRWLTDTEQEISMLTAPGVRADQIMQQQEKNERLMNTVANHKPLIDKFNKTGDAFATLVARHDGIVIHDVVEGVNSRYNALKTELRERQLALERALQETSQFADKLENMLRTLANAAEQVKNGEQISAHPPKISNQIDENWTIADDLEKREPTFVAIKVAADEIISKATNHSDPAVKEIKMKLEKLNVLWVDVQKEVKIRDSSLNDTLNAAEKFWNELHLIMDKLRELKDTLTSQEPVATEPKAIQRQKSELEEVGREIQNTKPEVDQVRLSGTNLITLIGDAEKPEIKKHIEDLDQAWGNITSLYAQREENLIQAMEKAMQFHETLEALLRFLDEAEEYMRGLKPIGSEIVLVKQQIEEHKSFKDRVDPHGVEIEALNRQLNELSEITSVDQTSQIRNGVNGINKRWDSLKQLMNDRQKQLENALLQLGQFEHALNELLVWIRKTQTTFEQIKIVPGDAKLLEIEMAKLKILINDAQAHQNSIDTINDAGRKLLENDDFIDASSTKEKLDNLNRLWQDLQHNIADKERELDEELVEAQNFATEVQDIITWLNDVDSVVGSTKPVGGLPETATEQLEKFMEIYNEIEENRPRVDNLLAQGANYVKKHAELNVSSSNLQHSLRTLKQRWEAVVSKAGDKKIKLEIALKEATEFHESLQAFVEWLTDAEKRLTTAESISRVLPTVTKQVEEHKAFQKEIGTYRESMLQLDKKGSHLKYFSQKQDVILIKNLLVSVQHRWERVVNKGTERMRALDHGLKESKEFYDSWGSLISWLRDNETQMNKIDSDLNGSNDSIKVKQALERIQNIHRGLSGKQTEYDALLRAGKALIDKAPKSDEPELTKMLNELKELWTKSCSRSIERQRKLEELLLLSGQFSEALTAILEWLKKAKESLTDETPLHGDIDTVTGLVDMHKRFEADLEKRSKPIDNVIENGKRLDPNNTAPEIIKNLREVESLWSFVKTMNEQKTEELQKAVKEAEKLHKNVNILMEWLSDAEQKLKYAPAIPTDEAEAQRMVSEFNVFLYEMRDKETDKNETLELAQNILDRAHPDAIKILRTIIQTIQQRWDEISQWALNRENKLSSHLQSLKDLDGTLDDLLAWLAGLERTLKNLEAEDLPNNVSEIEKLIEDHKEFMENTAGRQNEIDLICKPSKAKPSLKEARKPSRTAMRTTSRLSPSAISEAKAAADNGLPHYGPKFSPGVAEIDFRSPRARTLWDSWRNVWMLAWDRQKRLHEHLMMKREQAKLQSFDWEDWRKRFLKFHNHKRSRVVEFLKKIDKKQNGLIPREVFVSEIIASKAPTKRFEVEAVGDKFDPVSEGVIDWEDFLIALKPEWQQEPKHEADKIHDEVRRLVMLCTCRQKFRVFQVGEGKYRFGAEQKLRLVRILRSTVMVRVGGGWIALDEFLLKNDPCRARGKTNTELREEFVLAAGVSQTMQAFTPRQSISSASPGQPSRDYSSKSRQGSTTADSDHSDSVSAGRRTPSRTPLYTKTSIPIRSSLTPSTSSRSKPVSRHGSSISLASNDESTPTRIPTRKIGTTPKTPTSSTKPPVSSASKARLLSKKAEEKPPFR